MSIVYLNGEYLPLSEAKISVLDRGFLFADSLYEVIPVYNGTPFRLQEHLNRLQRNIDAIALKHAPTMSEFSALIDALLTRNNTQEQPIYLQITRGVQTARHHAYDETLKPTLLLMLLPTPEPAQQAIKQAGVQAITAQDCRWSRCDIKSTALLANIMLYQQGMQAGMEEVILLHEGYVTEGASSNVYVVHNDTLLTPPKSARLLGGITRDLILEIAEQHQLPYREATLAKATLQAANEIWISSSTREIVPVTTLDGSAVGDGKPGPYWQTMQRHFQAYKDALRRGDLPC